MPTYDLAVAENRCIQEDITNIIRDSLHKKLQPSHLLYNRHIEGDPELLRALSNVFNKFFNPSKEILPCHIALSPGASGCLTTLIQNLCKPNDGVLIPTPYWDGFDFHIKKQAQVCPVPVLFDSLTDSFDSAAITRALQQAVEGTSSPVRALVVTNPHNPLGRCYSEDNLQAFASFCARRDIHFISDEVYALSTFIQPAMQTVSPFVSALSLNLDLSECKRSRVHVIWSMSKDLGCSGLRLASLVSQDNAVLLRAMAFSGCLQISNLTTLSATAVLKFSRLPELISMNQIRLTESYQMIAAFLEQRGLEYIPATAGLYVFTRLVPTGNAFVDEARFAERLKASGILVSTGRTYHAGSNSAGWFRLVFSVGSTQLQEVLSKLGTVLDKLTPT